MAWGLLWLFLLQFTVNAQDAGFLVKNGLVNYVDNTPGAFFSVVFDGDSLINLGADKQTQYIWIDSSIFTIRKEACFEQLKHAMGSKKEIKEVIGSLIDSGIVNQIDFLEHEVLLDKINIDSFSVVGRNEKQIKIWYHKLPFTFTLPFPTELTQNKRASHVVYASFMANAYNVTLSNYVYYGESLEEKISYLKKLALESMKVYPLFINLAILDKQLESRDKNSSPVIYDSLQGLSMTFPTSMDFFNFGNTVVGYFNDSVKTESSISCFSIGKKETEYRYIATFQNYFLSQDEVIKQKQIENKNRKFICYEVLEKVKRLGKRKSFYVFFETKTTFNYIRFSSSADDYEEYYPKFEAFLDMIKFDEN